MRRRKLKKGDTSKSKYVSQLCQLCGAEDDIDEKTLSHLCYRCSIQKAHGFNSMPMLVTEEGECIECGEPTKQLLREMSADKSKVTERYLCSDCHEIKEVIDAKNLPKSDRPAGWRFMKEFVDADGTVYHQGEEQPDLKGTLPPTNVEKIKATQKEKRKLKKQKKAERVAKKEAKLVAEFEKKKKQKEKEEAKKEEENRKEMFFGD